MKFTQDYTSCHIPIWTKYLSKYKGQPCKMLEIGVFEGSTTVWFMNNILTHIDSRHWSIDTFEGGEDQKENRVDCEGIYERFLENIGSLEKKETVLIGISSEMLRKINTDFNIIYVDGSHIAKDVYSDISLSWPLLKVGGAIMFDDYLWDIDPVAERRPKVAIDKWMKENEGSYRIVYMDSIVILERIK